jgi:hypothetical protein
MTIQAIPCFSDPNWYANITLEGITYLFEFDFNQRGYCWYMSVADADGVDIYNGVKLSCNFSLLAKCKDPRAPAGAIWCLSSTSDSSPPGLYDLLAGGRCTLVYITSDWVTLLQTPAGLANIQAQLASNTQNTEASSYGQPTSG